MRAIPMLQEYFPGSLIGGKYELQAVIGQGGMGSVWRADNVVLEMPVAIKLIKPEVRGAGTTEMLLNEARLAAKLQHPSVVRLFDFGVAETGDAYIVMELLHGPSLADLLEHHTRLSAVAAVRLLLPIVHGLEAAHRSGIVHLDLKPENIVLAEAGSRRQPKLLDFGIAKKTGPHNASAAREEIIGSPAYMSPEQACGSSDIDERADIWGICVVLYELVSGRGPFTMQTPSETLRAVMESDPAPWSGDAAGMHALWSIVRAGLSKEREQRFGSARHLGRALAQWLLERGVQDDVCGDRLTATWRLGTLTRVAPTLASPSPQQARPVASKPAPRRRSVWMGAAACLSVAIPLLAVVFTDAAWSGSHSSAPTVDAGIAQLSEAARARKQPGHSTATSLMAASSTLDQSDAAESARSTDGSVSEAVVASETLPKTPPAPKVPSRRARHAQSKEAALGLKDPFQ